LPTCTWRKGSSRAHLGVHLPPYDTRAGLAALDHAIRHWRPKQVLLLGDSFHDGGGPERMPPQDRATLDRLATAADFTWLSGNHDPALPAHLPGSRVSEVVHWARITLRHEPAPGASAEDRRSPAPGRCHQPARAAGARQVLRAVSGPPHHAGVRRLYRRAGPAP
jgi:metallophosphoesterase superfamily enzyme